VQHLLLAQLLVDLLLALSCSVVDVRYEEAAMHE
jgi:hypothetical protein